MKRKGQMDLTSENEIKALKEAFGYSFRGPLGEKTLEFLEKYCGFWTGGPRENMDLLSYEQGKRDVILTIKTIDNPAYTPEMIAEIMKRSE